SGRRLRCAVSGRGCRLLPAQRRVRLLTVFDRIMPKMTKLESDDMLRAARHLAAALLLSLAFSGVASAGLFHKEREYVTAPPAPRNQTDEQVRAKSEGCQSCHTQTDQVTMHTNPAVKLG